MEVRTCLLFMVLLLYGFDFASSGFVKQGFKHSCNLNQTQDPIHYTLHCGSGIKTDVYLHNLVDLTATPTQFCGPVPFMALFLLAGKTTILCKQKKSSPPNHLFCEEYISKNGLNRCNETYLIENEEENDAITPNINAFTYSPQKQIKNEKSSCIVNYPPPSKGFFDVVPDNLIIILAYLTMALLVIVILYLGPPLLAQFLNLILKISCVKKIADRYTKVNTNDPD